MTRFSEQQPEIRQILIERINQRWKQLYDMQEEWGDRALKYLLLTNSGGAIATLGFLGASPSSITLFWAKVALLLFVLGVLFVGISTALIFHRIARLLEAWRSGVDDYYADIITYEHLCEQDKTRSERPCWLYITPYASFACFIGGSISGAFSLFL